MEIKTVGILGFGHFGAFMAELSERFLPEAQVRIFSRRMDPDGERFFLLKDTAASDVVILCGGIGEYDEQLDSLIPHLGERSVVVDVATVKKHTTELLRSKLPSQPWIATHPMFGAESYKKTDGDVSGYRIVVTDHNLEPEDYDKFKEIVSSLGFSVIEMTADGHDKLLADTLFMTHYIGQTMSAAGFGRTDIDTVSFQSLMNAVESVAQDERLFKDVYNYNPYCKLAADRFHAAQEKVWSSLPDTD